MGFYLSIDARDRVNDERRRDFFQSTLTDVFTQMDQLGITIEEVIRQYEKR